MNCGNYLHSAKEHAALNGTVLIDVIANDVMEKANNPAVKERAVVYITDELKEYLKKNHKGFYVGNPEEEMAQAFRNFKDDPGGTIREVAENFFKDIFTPYEGLSSRAVLDLIYDKVGLGTFGQEINDSQIYDLFIIDKDRFHKSVLSENLIQKALDEPSRYHKVVSCIMNDDTMSSFANKFHITFPEDTRKYLFHANNNPYLKNALFRDICKNRELPNIINNISTNFEINETLTMLENNNIRLSETETGLLRQRIIDSNAIDSITSSHSSWATLLKLNSSSPK